MYQIKRSEVLSETLQIEYHGKTLEVKCEMNLAKQMKDYAKANRSVSVLMAKAQNDILDDPKELGQAIMALFVLAFGEEQTQKIVDFYDNDHVTMLIDIMPFFNEVVTPMFTKQRKDKMDQLRKNAKRRRLFK